MNTPSILNEILQIETDDCRVFYYFSDSALSIASKEDR